MRETKHLGSIGPGDAISHPLYSRWAWLAGCRWNMDMLRPALRGFYETLDPDFDDDGGQFLAQLRDEAMSSGVVTTAIARNPRQNCGILPGDGHIRLIEKIECAKKAEDFKRYAAAAQPSEAERAEEALYRHGRTYKNLLAMRVDNVLEQTARLVLSGRSIVDIALTNGLEAEDEVFICGALSDWCLGILVPSDASPQLRQELSLLPIRNLLTLALMQRD